MSTAIEFTWDSRDLAVWRGGKVEGALTRALRLAGNQAIRSMQKDSTARIRAKKLLREKVVAEGLVLMYPSRKAAIVGLSWTMKVSGEPIPISRYPHIQTRRGVSFRVNTGGGTKRIKSAFTARTKSGHLGIFRRDGRFGRHGNPKLERISELWTSRLSDTMKDPGTIPAVHAAAYAKLQAAFSKGLEREMKKLRRKGEA
jgi:hypothetical protein